MTETKEYRILQIEGKITWQVEELWDGGTVRGPYGTKEAAKAAELRFAEEKGFADNLVLAGEIGRKVDLAEAFDKDEEGTWTCKQGCSIEINNKEIAFSQGLSFKKDELFMGVDIVSYLEEHTAKN
ncbi:MAG: hypothetical protein JW712_06660 [Dehalococcoidales bacterium]|nr:hypothetical protein [Dehalococcoidales bacterium]